MSLKRKQTSKEHQIFVNEAKAKGYLDETQGT